MLNPTMPTLPITLNSYRKNNSPFLFEQLFNLLQNQLMLTHFKIIFNSIYKRNDTLIFWKIKVQIKYLSKVMLQGHAHIAVFLEAYVIILW